MRQTEKEAIKRLRVLLGKRYSGVEFKLNPLYRVHDGMQQQTILVKWRPDSPTVREVCDMLFAENWPADTSEYADQRRRKNELHTVLVCLPADGETEICDQHGLELVNGRWERRPQFWRRDGATR